MIFRPRYRKQHYDFIILTAILVLTLAAVYFTRDYPSRILANMGIIVLVAVFFYFAYLIFAINRMHYILKNQGVFIQYGFTQILIPYDQITFVGRVSRTNWKKITGTEWNNYCVGLFNEFKLGIIQVFGVSRQNVILIQTEQMTYAITPYDNNLFAEQIAERWESKREPRLYPREINHRRLWQHPTSLVLAVVNIMVLIGQVLLIYLAITQQWIDLLNYNMLGDAVEQKNHYEFFLFSAFAALLTFHLTYSTDQLLKNGIDAGKKNLLTALCFNLLLIFIVGIMIIGS